MYWAGAGPAKPIEVARNTPSATKVRAIKPSSLMLPFGRAARQRVVIDLKPHLFCGRSSALSRGNVTFLGAPDRSGSAPVERDVLGRIQRVFELEAVRVDRQNRRLPPGDELWDSKLRELIFWLDDLRAGVPV